MILNHLWQSTVFAVSAWLLTLLLRNNRASLRYRIWFAASLKFLIPFSILFSIGSRIEWRPAAAAAPAAQVKIVLDQATRPFSEIQPVPLAAAPENRPSAIPWILFGIWIAGVAVSAASWLRHWRNARAILRDAVRRGDVQGVPILSTASRIEPGVFGILQPALLLPENIETCLTPEQIRAILAHEVSHVRRRDNLTAAMHTIVEAIFWFHPVLRLIRRKLAEERERACDEAVLRESVEPEVYAEGILAVCRFYMESRPVCVAAVSGGDLKKRIEAILAGGVSRLSAAKSLLIAAAALATLLGPVLVGIRAQEPALSFEVATVKPSNPGMNAWGTRMVPGRFIATNVPLVELIALAYDLPMMQMNRLTGGPEWVRSERFDVEAKTNLPRSPKAVKEMKSMLRTFLSERFQLVIRREPRDMPVYALTLGKNAPKLKKAAIEEKDCPQGSDANGQWCHALVGGMDRAMHGRAVNTFDIAKYLSEWTDRPFIDKTGLTGLYEVDIEGWTDASMRPPRPDGQMEDSVGGDPNRPSLSMILDKLGLKMEAEKAPVEMLVIEHAERPSGN